MRHNHQLGPSQTLQKVMSCLRGPVQIERMPAFRRKISRHETEDVRPAMGDFGTTQVVELDFVSGGSVAGCILP